MLFSQHPDSLEHSRRVRSYLLAPQILPRIGDMLRQIRHLAYIIALIFARAGIFPHNHPFLQPVNVGRYGFGAVFGAAANNLRHDRQHLPQLAIYYATVGMIVLAAIQMVLFVLSFSVDSAAAASIFASPSPDQDLALNLLGDMFGVYNFMGIAYGGGWPQPGVEPTHTGLHQILAYYSVGMMVVGAFIVGYYAFAAFIETSATGVPFGRRYNAVWVPIRVVLAFLLMIPMPMPDTGAAGLNAGQYFILFAARSGSGLGTNAFNNFINAVTQADHARDYVSRPQLPHVSEFVNSVFAMMTCIHAQDLNVTSQAQLYEGGPQAATWWRKSQSNTAALLAPAGYVAAPINAPNALLTAHLADRAAGDADGDIVITAGPSRMPEYCGALTIKEDALADDAGGGKYAEAFQIREAYLQALDWLVFTSGMNGVSAAVARAGRVEPGSPVLYGDSGAINAGQLKQNWVDHIKNNILDPVFIAVSNNASGYRDDVQLDMTINLVLNRGWAGAALFYNDLVKANLALQKAARSVPTLTSNPVPLDNYQTANPDLIDAVAQGGSDQADKWDIGFMHDSIDPGRLAGYIWGGLKSGTKTVYGAAKQRITNAVNRESKYDAEIGNAVGVGMSWFTQLPTDEQHGAPNLEGGGAGNKIWKIMLDIFGIGGLYDLAGTDPHTTNPLVVIQNIGVSLVNNSVSQFAIGALVSLPIIGSPSLGNFIMTLAFFGFGIGLFLAYGLPLLPFVYFFFGVVRWGFGVFEAIIAAPLWSLAHLRIDQPKLLPREAFQGYLMIFEIFVRPTIMIIALAASILTFTAAADVLHKTFFLAQTEFVGQATVGPIDSLAAVVMYAFIIYMLAMATFKLIDQIPESTFAWIGVAGAAYGTSGTTVGEVSLIEKAVHGHAAYDTLQAAHVASREGTRFGLHQSKKLGRMGLKAGEAGARTMRNMVRRWRDKF